MAPHLKKGAPAGDELRTEDAALLSSEPEGTPGAAGEGPVVQVCGESEEEADEGESHVDEEQAVVGQAREQAKDGGAGEGDGGQRAQETEHVLDQRHFRENRRDGAHGLEVPAEGPGGGGLREETSSGSGSCPGPPHVACTGRVPRVLAGILEGD